MKAKIVEVNAKLELNNNSKRKFTDDEVYERYALLCSRAISSRPGKKAAKLKQPKKKQNE